MKLGLFFILFQIIQVYGDIKLKHIKEVKDLKEYKKVLKTNKNVLTIYSKDDKSALKFLQFSEDVAKEIRGKGIIVYINCGKDKETKKLCKKYNVNPMPRSLKHYKDGSYHKDYDRKDTAKSLMNFMLDPSGDAPWEEDPNAKNIAHITNEKDFNRLRRNEKGPMLVMFYAPWCGYCKKLKPDYGKAATELKGKAVLVGLDVERAENHNLRSHFNITGYPTLIYFENGEKKFNYGGKMDKDGIIDWMKNPQPHEEKKTNEEKPWSEEAPEILHLTDNTFDTTMAEHGSVLVMFYAPWCGHCKKMKPELIEAANNMKDEEIPGTLAAVDCTKERKTCKRFDVSGYPTVKYFENGEMKFGVDTRTKDKIVEFMRSPEEPPPPPPEDLPWLEVSGPNVLHLGENTFKDELKKRKHVLIMFYAPWCGHCKKAKPEVVKAAEHFKDDRKINFAGVDCTIDKKVCDQYEVTGYPTFRYYLYGKKDFVYGGGRSSEAFIKFMNNPTQGNAKEPSGDPEWKDIPSGVVHLSDDDFGDFVSSHSSVLIMFYAPWCGHCKAMKPAYMEAASALLDTEHVLAAVDCTQHTNTAAKYDITGYPTLKYFNHGNSSDYKGGRSKDDFVSFFKKQDDKETAKPQVKWEDDANGAVIHLDTDTFEDYINQNDNVLVMFYAPWCGHCKRMKPDYIMAAEIVNKKDSEVPGSVVAVDCTVNKDISKKYGVKGYPTLKFFRNGKVFSDYKGQRKSAAMLDYMKNPVVAPTQAPVIPWSQENQDVVHLTDATFESYIQENPSVLMMFYAPWCGYCKSMKPAYAAAAKAINIQKEVDGKLAAVDCTKEQQTCKKYEIKGYPTIKHIKNGKSESQYDGDRSEKDIMNFMKGMQTQPTKTPSQLWEDEPSEIRFLNDENFDEFIKANDALVMFYAPWCGHCNSMKPAFAEAAKTLMMENSKILLAAINAIEHKETAKKEGVDRYPTLRFYSDGMFAEQYVRERDAHQFVKYIRQKSSSDIKLGENELFKDIPSSVLHLTTETFNEHLNKYPTVLVMLHSEVSRKCKKVRSKFMQAASRLSFSEKTNFAAVNCDENKDLCLDIDMAELPKFQFYNNGKFEEEYNKEITADMFVRYLIAKQQKEEL